MRTGILGGTFDPIHIGHLHIGETALLQVGLDRVLFMPAGEPWQKSGRPLSESAHRLEMTRLAVEAFEGFEADDREIKRAGPTYTHDTLGTFPEDEDLFLILGADAANGIPSWHRWEDVVGRARILVFPRPDVDLQVNEISSSFLLLHGPPLDISATAIREAAANGGAYRFLVPEPVHTYIEANRLYAKAERDDMVGRAHEQEDSS
ncbi:MAG: nicotinate-nucleotide adenylyltransferase [Acidimicrobiia bacterium]